jgi:DNA-binding transcriptional MerR regulator
MLTQLDLFGEPRQPEKTSEAKNTVGHESPQIQKTIHVQTPVDMPIPFQIEILESDAVKKSSSEIGVKKSGRGRKSIREMSLEAARIEIPADDLLFSKQYYSIGEVATMFSVNASLLRYWESEFDVFKLRKNKKGDRFFRPEDIKNLQLIHHLLRERKYTIEGAREFMRNSKKSKEKFEAIETLRKIRSFLSEMKAGLSTQEDPK